MQPENDARLLGQSALGDRADGTARYWRCTSLPRLRSLDAGACGVAWDLLESCRGSIHTHPRPETANQRLATAVLGLFWQRCSGTGQGVLATGDGPATIPTPCSNSSKPSRKRDMVAPGSRAQRGTHGRQPTGAERVFVPNRLLARNGRGEELSITALIRLGLGHQTCGPNAALYGGIGLRTTTPRNVEVPSLVSQIADGENGGVMMNEFPEAFRQANRHIRDNPNGTVAINGSEYIEALERSGVDPHHFPIIQAVQQHRLWTETGDNTSAEAIEQAISKLSGDDSGFSMEGASWTNNLSWVEGYANVLGPMNQLSVKPCAVRPSRRRNTLNHPQQGVPGVPTSGAAAGNQLFSVLGARHLDRIRPGDPSPRRGAAESEDDHDPRQLRNALQSVTFV